MVEQRKIVKCSHYGWGFKNNDDLCDNCLTRKECSELSLEAHIKVQRGYQPNIPLRFNTKKKPMEVRLATPVVKNNKLVLNFIVKIDMDWFRRYLGSGTY